MRVRTARLAALGLAGLFLASAAATPSDDDIISPDATEVKWDFAKWCDIGPHHFIFEKTTLGDIIAALGASPMTRTGDAGAAVFEWQVAYHDRDQIITFSSNSDMGGDDHALGEIEVARLPKDSRAKFPTITWPIKTQAAQIGTSLAQVRGKLGKARLTHAGIAEFEYLGKWKGKDLEGRLLDVDVTGWLRLKIAHGKVTELTLSHVTSN